MAAHNPEPQQGDSVLFMTRTHLVRETQRNAWTVIDRITGEPVGQITRAGPALRAQQPSPSKPPSDYTTFAEALRALISPATSRFTSSKGQPQ